MRLTALLAACVLAAAACGKAEPPVEPRPTSTPTVDARATGGGAQVLDMALRTVSLPPMVRRVVALSPTALEYVAAFELDIVGRVSDAVYPAQAATAPTVGTTIAPKFGAIAALQPDLVIGDASLQGASRKDFDQFPYPVFLVRVASYEDALQAFRALGEAVGKAERAESLVAEAEARIGAARAAADGRASPRVLVLTGSGRDVYAGNDATFVGSLLQVLGATNVMGLARQGAPLAGFGLVEVEQAARTNPDVVLVISGPQSDLAAQVGASKAWERTTAVRDGRVAILDPAIFLRSPGPRVAAAVEELARLLYR